MNPTLRMLMTMRLVGLDLAWRSEINTMAAAFGDLNGSCFQLTKICPALSDLGEVKSVIQSEDKLFGIAVDAPLIINNKSGQRECERLVGKDYGRRGASCHSSNLDLYPNPAGVELSRYLKERGYEHLQNAAKGKFQIECYPHPAIIEMFGLPERLAYKKGKVSDKKQGQIQLSRYIKALEKSRVISLIVSEEWHKFLEQEYIRSLTGKDLKVNEDVLDSIICVYICALFATSSAYTTYGSIADGYIYVPKQKCILDSDT